MTRSSHAKAACWRTSAPSTCSIRGPALKVSTTTVPAMQRAFLPHAHGEPGGAAIVHGVKVLMAQDPMVDAGKGQVDPGHPANHVDVNRRVLLVEQFRGHDAGGEATPGCRRPRIEPHAPPVAALLV